MRQVCLLAASSPYSAGKERAQKMLQGVEMWSKYNANRKEVAHRYLTGDLFIHHNITHSGAFANSDQSFRR